MNSVVFVCVSVILFVSCVSLLVGCRFYTHVCSNVVGLEGSRFALASTMVLASSVVRTEPARNNCRGKLIVCVVSYISTRWLVGWLVAGFVDVVVDVVIQNKNKERKEGTGS